MKLVYGITGAAGTQAARILIERSNWPVWLVASKHGRIVYEDECGEFQELAFRCEKVFSDDDLTAPIASGSVKTIGMVILPCTTNTLGKIAAGIADTLITRAAHCHLKEKRPLILVVRETPWTSIDFENAARITSLGATVMPYSIPYYLFRKRNPEEVTMRETIEAFVDRVLQQFGAENNSVWKKDG